MFFVEMPALQDDLPWPILRVVCRIEKIMMEILDSRDFSRVSKLISFVIEAESLKKKYKECEKIIDLFLLHAKYAQLKCEYQESHQEVKSLYADITGVWTKQSPS